MGVTYLDECYISVRWVLHIWATVTYLDGNMSARISLDENLWKLMYFDSEFMEIGS